MPTYTAIGSVGSQHGIPVVVWNNESPASGAGGASASMAVALPDTAYTKHRPFSVAGKFAAGFGAGEVDVQVADVDVDNQYQTAAGFNITSFDATNGTFEADVSFNTKKFARLLMRTTPGTAVTATITP